MKTRFVIFLILLSQPVFSQSISGIIKDKKTGELIPYAHVSIKGRSTGTITNSDGIFKLVVDGISDFDSLKISHVGYTTKFLSAEIINQKLENVIEMEPLVVSLHEVMVSGKDPFDYFLQVVKATQSKTDYPFSTSAYYREIVKDNSECSKYSDALLKVNYMKEKDDIVVGVEQARVIQLPKEEDDFIIMASPLDVTKLFAFQYLTILNRFQGENRKYYNYSMYKNAGESDTYTIQIDPIGTTEKNKILYFAELVVENERIRDVTLKMDTTTHLEKSFLGTSFTLTDLQIVLSFNDIKGTNYLSFGKMYCHINFDRKKSKQINEFQSDFIVVDVTLDQLKTIEKKQRLNSKTIYKHGDNHTSNFWEGINMPIQSKMENDLIEKLKASQIK